MHESPRFPAEWEPQSAILLAWPHAGTDWADRLGDVEDTYIALVQAITRFQPALVCVADDDVETYADIRLRSNRVNMARVRFVTVAYDDTWLTWYFGDVLGVILVAPFLLTCGDVVPLLARRRQLMEVSAMLSLTLLTSVVIFSGAAPPNCWSGSDFPTASRIARRNCRAARCSAWRSRGH